jgi:translocation and assembly module TamA
MPAPMSAFDLKFTSNALSDELSDTSLLLPLSDPSSMARAQDVVATAQADYARLIGVMYDRGFFCPAGFDPDQWT